MGIEGLNLFIKITYNQKDITSVTRIEVISTTIAQYII